MLNFQPIALADRGQLHSYLYRSEPHGSEYSFANLFFWGEQTFAEIGKTPVFLSRFGSHYSYLFPFDRPELLPLLRDDAHARGIPFRVFGMTENELKHFPASQYGVRTVRDSSDYVYDIERLTELRGKKLQAKRNHCNRFEAEHPDYRVLPLDAELLALCRAFTERWYAQHLENGSEADYEGERKAIALAFDHFDALHMEGVALTTEQGMVAFAMGNRIRETVFDVNFEKALADVNGAYPMINREFARLLHARYPAVRLLNREDDMGIAGLRRAKESYFPDLLLEKYLAEERT